MKENLRSQALEKAKNEITISQMTDKLIDIEHDNQRLREEVNALRCASIKKDIEREISLLS
jgi:hypothetical protein